MVIMGKKLVTLTSSEDSELALSSVILNKHLRQKSPSASTAYNQKIDYSYCLVISWVNIRY